MERSTLVACSLRLAVLIMAGLAATSNINNNYYYYMKIEKFAMTFLQKVLQV